MNNKFEKLDNLHQVEDQPVVKCEIIELMLKFEEQDVKFENEKGKIL